MANQRIESTSDAFMPEYWPANRLVGELENILVKAQNIIGEIEGKQIKNLEAGKIIGQLTNEQLAEIAAAKIAGQLTNAQIESLETAKLLGTIKEVQIAEGAISAKKIAANAVTAEKILAESITALKIAAGAVTTAKIAAGAITAEKLSVEKLSAITANLGTVTAGIIEGIDIKLPESTNEKAYPDVSKIEWMSEGKIHSWIGAFGESTHASRFKLITNETKERKESWIEFEARSKSERGALLEITAWENGAEILIGTSSGLISKKLLLIDNENRSDFAQVSSSEKRIVVGGVVTAAGAVGSGTDFTVVRTAKGHYTITVSGEFAVAPAVAITMAGALAFNLSRYFYGANPAKEFKVETFTISGAEFVDAEFSFIAFG